LLSLKRPVTGRDGLADIEAEDYDGQSGATKEDSKDTSMGQSIAATAAGSYVFYDKVDLSDGGVNKVDLRVNAQAATTLELHADTQAGTLIGKCDITATAGSWATQSCTLTKTTGVHAVYAVFGGAMRLNSLKFQPADGSTTGGTGGAGGAVGSGGMGSGTAGSGTASGGAPSTGTGGSPSTGGAATQAGGSTAAGGSTSASGGNSSVAGGTANNGAGGTVTGGAKPATDSGCGCRVASQRASWLDGAAVLPGLAALGLLMRRRRPRS
jgi:MYXO-CTERM domain-containing protein